MFAIYNPQFVVDLKVISFVDLFEKNNFSQIASIAATRVESMRDLLIRSVYIKITIKITIIILIIAIIIIAILIINFLSTRWEEMSISGEKDTMDFQPLTQFLKCYAIYFASWLSFDYLLIILADLPNNVLTYSRFLKHSHP